MGLHERSLYRGTGVKLKTVSSSKPYCSLGGAESGLNAPQQSTHISSPLWNPKVPKPGPCYKFLKPPVKMMSPLRDTGTTQGLKDRDTLAYA